MCDLCQDQFVGSYMIPFLRNVLFDEDQKYSAYVNREFDNGYYIPLQKSIFDSIKIQILNEFGKKINLTSEKVTARLLIRKKYIEEEEVEFHNERKKWKIIIWKVLMIKLILIVISFKTITFLY
jgi:hypothetical protein